MSRHFLVYLVLLLLVNACSRGGRKGPEGGGVDGGGGDFVYNTRAQVLEAVAEMWALAYTSASNNPVLVAYWVSEDRPLFSIKSDEEEFISKTLATMIGNGAEVPRIYDFVYRDDQLVRIPIQLFLTSYLQNKKLHLLENGLCNGPGDHKFLGAVTKLERSGEVCISVYGLMRVPSSSLRSDLLALIFHEIAHLNGYGENDARRLQRFVLNNMARILRKDGRHTRTMMAMKFTYDVTRHWTWLVEYNKITADYINKLDYMIQRLESIFLYSVDGIWEPGRFDDLNVPRPDLYESLYTKNREVIALMRSLRKHAFDGKKGVDEPRAKVTPAMLKQMREIGLGILDLDRLVRDYLLGKVDYEMGWTVARHFSKERAVVEDATHPELLTDEKARPKVECGHMYREAEEIFAGHRCTEPEYVHYVFTNQSSVPTDGEFIEEINGR